jgi:hypothetical protein
MLEPAMPAMPDQATMPAATTALVGALLGAPVAAATAVERGYSNNRRWLVTLVDGRTAFVKGAVDGATADWLRLEAHAYAHLRGRWRPALLGWQDGERPLLVLEDLSRCVWPPPWSAPRVEAVQRALTDIARQPPPPGLRRLVDSSYAEAGWPQVASDPEPFLRLGLCSERWLRRALDVLLAAADVRLLDGDALCHLDVRSDNLCFREGEAILVDWNLAAVGNPDFDRAFWLPSLHAEGGPPPAAVADVPAGVAALVAGFFASRAGLRDLPQAPRVRHVQRTQLAVALPWAAAAVGLPPPG